MQRIRASVALLALAAGSPASVAHGIEPGRGGATGPNLVSAEISRQFDARKRLDAMGLRGLSLVAASQSSAGSGGAGVPSTSATTTYYRARVVAPALAFLHGLCDSNGGLPRFGSTMDFAMRSGPVLELRSSYLGEIANVDGKPSGMWIWDVGRLPENVRAVRGASAVAPR